MRDGWHLSYLPPLKGRFYSPRKLPLHPSKYLFLSVFIFYYYLLFQKAFQETSLLTKLARKAPVQLCSLLKLCKAHPSKVLMGSPKRFLALTTEILNPHQGQIASCLSQSIRAFTAMHNLCFWRPLVLNCSSHAAGPSDRKPRSKAHFWTQW